LVKSWSKLSLAYLGSEANRIPPPPEEPACGPDLVNPALDKGITDAMTDEDKVNYRPSDVVVQNYYFRHCLDGSCDKQNKQCHVCWPSTHLVPGQPTVVANCLFCLFLLPVRTSLANSQCPDLEELAFTVKVRKASRCIKQGGAT